MASELKIVVGAPGAKEAAADLKGVAAAEQAVGAAAQAGAAGVAKTTAAKKGASEAAGELQMRDQSLLRQLAALSPECAIAADAMNQFMTKTTSAGLALGLVGAAIGATAYAISLYTQAQADEKRKAEAVLSALKDQYDVYLKMAGAIERAARAKGALGAGTGPREAARFVKLAPEGVSLETAQRAGELAVALPAPVTDEQAQAMMLGLTLHGEPAGRTDRARAMRLRGGDLATLQGEFGAFKAAVPPEMTFANRMEMFQARKGLEPEAAQASARNEAIKSLALHRGITEEEAGRIIDLAGDESLVRAEELFETPWSYLQQARKGQYFGAVGERREARKAVKEFAGAAGMETRETPGVLEPRAVSLIFNGGTQYFAPGADPAGQIPRSAMK